MERGLTLCYLTPESIGCYMELVFTSESVGLSHGDNAYTLPCMLVLFLLVVIDHKFGILWKQVFNENWNTTFIM